LHGRRATAGTPATSAAETPATARTTAGAPSMEASNNKDTGNAFSWKLMNKFVIKAWSLQLIFLK
jgi:hypothetical protein